jgi:uncharacterized membrane protein
MSKTKKDINRLINEHNKLSGFIIFFTIWSFVIGISFVLGNSIFASIIFIAFVFAVEYFTIKELLL